jgi:uncharacterized membrane protein
MEKQAGEKPSGTTYATTGSAMGMPALESTPVKKFYDAANGILILVLSYTVFSVYPKLPESFPTHFNFAGQPDGWGGKSTFIILAAVAWILTLAFYILVRYMPRLARNPRYVNIPHKEKFLKLPGQKQMEYWALLAEFMTGLLAALNLLMYLSLRGITLIAMGEETIFPFMYIWPATGLILALTVFYSIRLINYSGKLSRIEI